MKKRWIFALVLPAILLILAAWLALMPEDDLPVLSDAPRTGKWYAVEVQNALSADGSPWHGYFRPGSQNRVLIYFSGGGLSLDEYSAARPYSAVGGDAFYYDSNTRGLKACTSAGLCSDARENPFSDWTVIAVPYTTGDFHAGAGEAGYTSLQGEEKTLHHRGYTNCMALIEKLSGELESPEALLIAGSSAGGFAAAMLAQDIIACFPKTENITVCADAALLLDDWAKIARERWYAPEHIAVRMKTENLTLDHLSALHESMGERVKILFCCSIRDGVLAKFQQYMNGGEYAATEAGADVHQKNLRAMVQSMQESLPHAGLFIHDLPASGDSGSLTRHTLLNTQYLFEKLNGRESAAQWIMSAVEGRVFSRGTQLLMP